MQTLTEGLEAGQVLTISQPLGTGKTMEDKEDTLAGVRELADCGCIPVLSAFVPAQGTFMERYLRPEAEFLLEVVHEAAAIARRNQTVLGPLCRPCTHNSLTEEDGSIEISSDIG